MTRDTALKFALEDARDDRKNRFVHLHYGRYFIRAVPVEPGSAEAANGSDFVVVFPHGTYTTYHPQTGPPNGDPHRQRDHPPA